MSDRFVPSYLLLLILLAVISIFLVAGVASAARGSVEPLQQGRTETPTKTSTPTPTPSPTRSGPFVASPGRPLIFDFPTPRTVGNSGPIAGTELSAMEKSFLSVVKIEGCAQARANECTTSNGSGSIIHPKGLILTALQVVIQDPSNPNSPPFPEISISIIPNPETQTSVPTYRAKVAAINTELGLALLEIIRSPNQPELYLPSLPIESITSREFRNAELKTMGFQEDEQDLKVPAIEFFGLQGEAVQVEGRYVTEGFTGGPTLVEREERNFIGGVTLYRPSGPVLVQPVQRLAGLRWLDPPTLRTWGGQEKIEPAYVGGLVGLELSINIHAIDLAGHPLRLEAIAYDSQNNQPWPSAANPFTLRRTFSPVRLVDVIPLELSQSLIGLGAVPQRLRFILRVQDMDEQQVLWSGETYYVPPLSPPTPKFTATPTRTPTTIAPTRTPTPTRPAATRTPTPTRTPIATSTPNRTATARVQATSTARARATATARRQATIRAGATATAEALILPLEIMILLDEWDRIHHQADRTMDTSELSAVLGEEALRQQLQTIDRLRSTNCYWIFTDLSPATILAWRRISSTELIVDVRKHWDGKLYCNGRLNTGGSFSNPFNVRYNIRKIDEWRIILKTEISDSEVMSN